MNLFGLPFFICDEMVRLKKDKKNITFMCFPCFVYIRYVELRKITFFSVQHTWELKITLCPPSQRVSTM